MSRPPFAPPFLQAGRQWIGRTQDFIAERLPKYLGYLERVATRNNAPGHWLVGRRLSYADLSMAQIMAGLHYAFPNASRAALRKCAHLRALHEAVFLRPRIQRYQNSGRRLAFNNDGIFRHYPELDR